MGLVALIVSLAVVATGMGCLLYVMLTSVEQVKTLHRPGLMRLAWLTLAVLGATLVLLLWAVIRAVGMRLRPEHKGPTPYVDAWSIAGQRACAPKPPEDQSEGSDDDGGRGDKFSPPGKG